MSVIGRLSMPLTSSFGRMRVLRVAHADLDAGVEGAADRAHSARSGWCRRGSRNHTACLGAAQNLDVIEILQPQIHEQRRVIHVGGTGGTTGEASASCPPVASLLDRE